MPRVSPAAVLATGEQAPSTAKHILDVAGALFYQRGFAATGIDRIVRESGVAKMTLYRHFPSKDALVTAWLERVDADFWRSFETWAGPEELPARERLLGVFHGLRNLVASPKCLGCPFLLASSEFPEPGTRAHDVARQHKVRLRERLRAMAARAGASDADALGDQLLLLMDGAFVAARLFGGTDHPGRKVVGAAEVLVGESFHASSSPTKGPRDGDH